jgi:hypothetical protein
MGWFWVDLFWVQLPAAFLGEGACHEPALPYTYPTTKDAGDTMLLCDTEREREGEGDLATELFYFYRSDDDDQIRPLTARLL